MINIDKTESLIVGFEDDKVHQEMKKLTDEICALLYSLNNLASSAEEKIVMQNFQNIIVNDIEPILKYFS